MSLSKQITFVLLFFSPLICGAQQYTGLALTSPATSADDSATENIRLNQLGFYPDAPKIAVIIADGPGAFRIESVAKKQVVFKGTLIASTLPALNGKKTLIADFSALRDTGAYILVVDGL